VIAYLPQKDNPQIYFIRNRIRAEELRIDGKAYMERKKQMETRIAAMTTFIRDTKTCRSKSIGAYFGDKKLPDCGICDNCLNAKAAELSKEEFEKIRIAIESVLSAKPLQVDELLKLLTSVKKEKAWKVIDHLQAEHIIMTDSKGWIRLK
jgi:ATP-dependent DNA helicase RecQ